MAYNDEALKAKLSTLNETAESIQSVSQWMSFHRRSADKIVPIWHQRLRDAPPNKRLNFIYLANDIVQNARTRKRVEYPNAFAAVIPEAVQQAYRSVPADTQGRIKRVLEVWQTRGVFEPSILQAIQARIEDADKSKPTTKKALMGQSLFASSSTTGMPKELESLGPLQTAYNKAEFAARPLIDAALAEHNALNNPDVPRPSAPVFAANLSSLIKKLTSAEASLTEAITARKALIADLKRLTEANEAALIKDESTYVDVSAKRISEEARRRDVEDSIMRGLAETQQDDDDYPATYNSRPDVEELTPEPEEIAAFESTPQPRNPNLAGILAGFGSSNGSEPMIPVSPPLNYSTPTVSANGAGPSSNKKRKLSHDASESAVPDLGAMGVTGFDGAADMTYPSMAQPLHTESTLESDVEALIRGSAGGSMF